MSVKKYIIFRKEVIELSQGVDGLFRDHYGTIYALRDESASLDEIDRCGVGILSLPAGHILTRGCRPHDFMFSSRAYQVYHFRSEADDELQRYCTELGYPVAGAIMSEISRGVGGWFWENEETR